MTQRSDRKLILIISVSYNFQEFIAVYYKRHK